MRNGGFENTSAAMEAANERVDQELQGEGSGASNEQCSLSEEILSLQGFNDFLL